MSSSSINQSKKVLVKQTKKQPFQLLPKVMNSNSINSSTSEYMKSLHKRASLDQEVLKEARFQKEISQPLPLFKKERRYGKKKSFRISKIFKDTNTIKKSYLEISLKLGMLERSTKRAIAADIESGFITKKTSKYKCSKYKTPLCGINTYYLTDKGKKYLNRLTCLTETPQTRISSLEDIAKYHEGTDYFPSELHKKEAGLFERYGFKKLLRFAPNWWFNNLPLLEKCLRLLRDKQLKGYRCRSKPRFISMLIKQNGIGFRKRIVQEMTEKLSGSRKMQTAHEEIVLKSLSELESQGLNLSTKSLQSIFRKGLSHLQPAITVLKKYIEWKKPIKSLNGMLYWIISQEDPLELLKPIAKSPTRQISKLKYFLSHHASYFIFNKPLENKTLSNKIHIELLIHTKSIRLSIVKLYKWINKEWKCLTLDMGKTTGDFFEVVIQALQRYFGDHFEGKLDRYLQKRCEYCK